MRAVLTVIAAEASLLVYPCAVWAQEMDGASGSAATADHSEIIVQARRRDESAQDVPLVVQAVTADSLQKLNIRDFKDIQTLVPGLAMGQDPNGIAARSTLRGIAYDVNASGNNGTVEFYLNDAPLSAAILFQSMFDVGQIEVLRGPQGTLRGRASPSGSITVTTQRPDLTEVGAYVNGTVNNIGGWNFQGALNIPVIQDRLGVRIAGVVDENEDNRVHSLINPADPFQENRGIRASVSADPFDALRLFFSYTRSQRRTNTFDQVESGSIADPTLPASGPLIRGSDRLAVMGALREHQQDFAVYNWSAELSLFGQNLNYVGSYNTQRYQSIESNDRGGFFGPEYPYAVQQAGVMTDVNGKQRNHELRLSSSTRIAGIFDYVVGVLHNKIESPTNLRQSSVSFSSPVPSPETLNPIATVVIDRNTEQKETSYFGNITAHVSDAAEIAGGVRRIRYSHKGDLRVGGALLPPAESISESATIFSASAKYRFSPDLMVYANFGTSWRPGSSSNPTLLRNIIATVTPAVRALLMPPAETSKSYEVGFKSDWLDKRLRLNVSAYHQTFENFSYFAKNPFVAVALPIPQVVPNITGLVVGVPAKVSGVEGEVQFQATPNWNLSAVMSYTHSKVTGRVPCNDYFPHDGVPDSSSLVPTFAQVNAATNGDLIAFCEINARAGLSAPFTGTFQTEYNQPLNSNLDGYLRGLVTYYGNSQNDPVNLIDDVKAYALVNLFAGLRSPNGGWDIGLYGKNIFDVGRVLSRQSSLAATPYRTTTGAANAVSEYRGITYTAPREFGVTMRVAIGSR